MKQKRRLLSLALLSLIVFFMAVPLAAGQGGPSPESPPPLDPGQAPAPPAISGRSALLVNATDGKVLYSQNADERLPMASTTKMMTALIVIENHRSNLNDIVTCSQRAAEVGESSIWLTAGEKLTVKEMLIGLLVQSGNDAATALAEYDAGSVEAFVNKMNNRAAELGLSNTHFMNPHGLHDPNHFTTASDFVKLGREVLKHPELREIIKMSEVTIPWTGQPYGRSLVNHNHFLDIYPGVYGIKTGFTDEAGQCIIVAAGQDGTDLVLAYLGGPSLSQRNDDVINLLDFGFASYRQMTVISAGTEYASIDLPFNHDRKLLLISDASLSEKIYVREPVEYRVVLPDEIRLPIHRGDKIGLVEAYEGNMYLGSTYLVATEDVSRPDIGDRLNYYIEAIYNFLLSVIKLGD